MRLVIDVHQPESLSVAMGPLEVVEEAPHEVAPYVDTVLDRPMHLPEVSVDELDSIGVVERTIPRVLECSAVLRDVNGG